MSDKDMIRRGDAIAKIKKAASGKSSSGLVLTVDAGVEALREIPAAQPSPDVAALVEALEWYISEDDTNEGDDPMPDHGNRSWDEINAYWIEGKRKAIAALARVKGGY